MQILEIHQDNPNKHKIEKAAEILLSDGVIVYPTDTSYGFGCNIVSKKAVERIYRIKQETHKKLFSVVCYDLSQIAEYAIMSNWAYRFLKSLLPGPFTIIMNATNRIPNFMHNKRKQVGIRMPANNICHDLVELCAVPLLSTTVRIADDEVYADPWMIAEDFKHQVDAVIDGGYLEPEMTTVIDITDDAFTVVRQGKGNIDRYLAE